MQPQALERRVERLEQRVTILEQLPARVEELAGQILQLRKEMRMEFSAVRTEIRDGDETTRRVLHEEIQAAVAETRRVVRETSDEIMGQARTLYEAMDAKLALIQEGTSPGPARPRRRSRE